VGRDDRIYGCGGSDYDAHLFAYDHETGRFTDFGQVYDPQRKTSCVVTHWITEARPGLFYVSETDNLDRTGYLWKCQIQ